MCGPIPGALSTVSFGPPPSGASGYSGRMAQNEQEFERLKAKYQPALAAVQQYQVHLQNLHLQGNQLFIRGEAPSQEAKNRVWDQIKQVDPTYSDLIADITVSEQAQ